VNFRLTRSSFFLLAILSRPLRAFGATALLILASAAIGADEAAPVPKPDVKVGDSWNNRVSIYQSNTPIVFEVKSRVSFVGPGVIVAVESGGDGKESDSQYDSEWGISSLGYMGMVFEPLVRFYKFPLQVGAEYPFVNGLAAQRGSAARSRIEGTAKVLGWEDVVVPAGKFRALKVEAKASIHRLDTNSRGWQRYLVWYVPEVKQAVKFSLEGGERGPNELDLLRTTELVEFKVQ